MIDRAALLDDLKPQVARLEKDLRERSGEPEFAPTLEGEYAAAREAKRTAATYETWLGAQVTQAAVAWVLGTVFVRFCEDNGLIEHPYLSGPGEAGGLAVDRQAAFFQAHPERTDRDWIVAAFDDMGRSPVAAGLFDPAHNPMWRITPSHDAAKELLAFWRRRDESGAIVHDFADPELGTRFLGDLYQDLSEQAKKGYALLQTPEFVEEFILDLTLEPAVDEFGLAPENSGSGPNGQGLRVIDPTCGSGHFLLGAFHRLLDKWRAQAPGKDEWERISAALASVHGVDKNPFAAAIARFRLLVAAMRAGWVTRIDQAPDFPIYVAVGDSLLHGRGAPGIQEDLFAEPHTYATEDVAEYARRCDILGIGSYHVVVGNPPYITVKDKQENDNYRAAYKTCSGQYQLSVPFVERFFQLATRGSHDGGCAGYVGQIIANGFMKREFGKKLIEEFFPTVALTHVIDTSGAYIPGHGTPTVILAGRRRWPKQGTSVRAVLGIRGEPEAPNEPAEGLVWGRSPTRSTSPAARASGSASTTIHVTNLPSTRGASVAAARVSCFNHLKKLRQIFNVEST